MRVSFFLAFIALFSGQLVIGLKLNLLAILQQALSCLLAWLELILMLYLELRC